MEIEGEKLAPHNWVAWIHLHCTALLP